MDKREWPLVLFTIIIQGVVGLLIAVLVYGLTKDAAVNLHVMTRIMKAGVITSAVLLPLSLVISTMHLGSPLCAPYASRNLKTSWLSREGVTAGVLTALVWLWMILAITGVVSWHSIHLLFTILAIIGLALVFFMSRIYMIRTVPAWNSVLTPIDFFTTMLLLGMLGLIVISMMRPIDTDIRGDAMILHEIMVAVILGAIKLIVVICHPFHWIKAGVGEVALRGARWESMKRLYVLRTGLLLGGIVYLGISLMTRHTTWTFIALGAILLSEILGRYQFYASYRRVGL